MIVPQKPLRTAVVFDLEFTAWENSLHQRWLAPGEFKEVVQIGAVKVDAHALKEIESFEVLVRPRINSIITPFLEELTGIGNAAIAARGVDFLEAYRSFVEFAADGMVTAFGRDDLVLAHNIRLYGIANAPPLPLYLNIATWLRANGIETAGLHACDLGPACGAEFKGRQHDALDDARSVATGIAALVAKGAPNPFLEKAAAA